MPVHQSQEMTRLIESFDSVRHSPTAPDLTERKTHAQLELMLSMLFGERMAVPEPYSFDSLAFLSIAADVLTARPPRRKNTPVWDPFLLFLREALPGHDSYRGMVADLLRKGEKFVLSGWPEIDKDPRERGFLATHIWNGDWKEAACRLDPEKVDSLRILDSYFSQVTHARAEI
ncbi:MAG: hypothetical protein L0387_17415, partial [Acidobacteria bacterium]|nr:hypothetical protein [Acidobacteriota bacterium]